jgi:hypothetical protein
LRCAANRQRQGKREYGKRFFSRIETKNSRFRRSKDTRSRICSRNKNVGKTKVPEAHNVSGFIKPLDNHPIETLKALIALSKTLYDLLPDFGKHSALDSNRSWSKANRKSTRENPPPHACWPAQICGKIVTTQLAQKKDSVVIQSAIRYNFIRH